MFALCSPREHADRLSRFRCKSLGGEAQFFLCDQKALEASALSLRHVFSVELRIDPLRSTRLFGLCTERDSRHATVRADQWLRGLPRLFIVSIAWNSWS
jgi:hypothetical protein